MISVRLDRLVLSLTLTLLASRETAFPSCQSSVKAVTSNRGPVSRKHCSLSRTNLDGTIDWTFASLENLREATNPGNPWPCRKVAAAMFLDAAPAAFRTRVGQTSMLDEYIHGAENQWRAWMASPYVWHTLDRRDLLYAVILRAMLESWACSSVTQGVELLVTYASTHLRSFH
jgi:hypothetical protein